MEWLKKKPKTLIFKRAAGWHAAAVVLALVGLRSYGLGRPSPFLNDAEVLILPE